MPRSALVWTLTTAFLVTLPVTGAGRCPCRFVNSLRTPQIAPGTRTTVSPALKCCCHSHLLDVSGDAGQKPPLPPHGPTDAPCDHRMLMDVALAGPSGERSGSERGVPDAESVVDSGGLPPTHLAPRSVTTLCGVDPAPSRHVLRYAHAFRS